MYATFNFSLNLSMVLIYVTAIFDARAVDTAIAGHAISLATAWALVSCGVVVLSGLAGYVLSSRRLPEQAARTAFLSACAFSNQFCLLAGLSVWVARAKGPIPRPASVRRSPSPAARGWCVSTAGGKH